MRPLRSRLVFRRLNEELYEEVLQASGPWSRCVIRKLQRCVCCLREYQKGTVMYRPVLETLGTGAVARYNRACSPCVELPGSSTPSNLKP